MFSHSKLALCILPFSHAVPGVFGSQLDVRVTSSELNCECCTNWIGLWINITRGAAQPDCFLNELT